MTLQILWFALWGVIVGRLFHARRLRFRRGHAAQFPRQGRGRARPRARRDRSGLERQRSVAHHGGRSDLRRLPPRLRLDVQLPLSAHAAHPVFAHRARSLHRVPRQVRRREMAFLLGLGPRGHRALRRPSCSASASATSSRGCPSRPTAIAAASGCSSTGTGCSPRCSSSPSSSSTAPCGWSIGTGGPSPSARAVFASVLWYVVARRRGRLPRRDRLRDQALRQFLARPLWFARSRCSPSPRSSR